MADRGRGRGGRGGRGGGGGGGGFGRGGDQGGGFRGRGGPPPADRGGFRGGGQGRGGDRGRGGDQGPGRGGHRGGGDRGGGRGGGGRGGPGGRGRGRGGGAPMPDVGPPLPPIQFPPPPTSDAVNIPGHIQAVGVKRVAYGKSGRLIQLRVNMYSCNVPDRDIVHYDVTIPPDDKFPVRLNLLIIRAMQDQNPNVFTPRGVYDGRKNFYATFSYSFGAAAEYQVHVDGREYRVRLKKVNVTSTVTLQRLTQRLGEANENVSTALNALNVAVRMEPISRYPFNAKSFYVDTGTWDIGSGFELRRGFFQSIRPTIGKTMINIDIATGAFFKPGPLGPIAMELMRREGIPYHTVLTRTFSPRDKVALLKHLKNRRIQVKHRPGVERTIAGFSNLGADEETFMKDGVPMTVAAYIQRTYNITLQYPKVLCVNIGSAKSRALVPIELCSMVPGQLLRKQISPDLVDKVVDFATLRPDDRIRTIQNGLATLQYQESPYLADFGVTVGTSPAAIYGRVLPSQKLQYGGGKSKNPENGAWNMMNLKVYQSGAVKGVVIIVYVSEARFRQHDAADMIRGLSQESRNMGMSGMPDNAAVYYENPQGNSVEHIVRAGQAHKQAKGDFPNLVLVVLPEHSTDLYYKVKNAGDIKIGVATQCINATKYLKAKGPQYFANVILKINAKLGGTNAVLTSANPNDAISFLTDSKQPTIVIGADVMHPGPGAEKTRPSFAAVTGSLTSPSKYTAAMRAQQGRVEIIQDLNGMLGEVLASYKDERRKAGLPPNPTRMLFYRDGVSEGEFKTVKELEVPQIREACAKAGIKNIKLTFVVVGRRHHIRFFPHNKDDSKDADRSGNAPAGTVVDRDITHPIEFDFYLQSHGGLKGTSRSAHYNVLVDENNFARAPDSLQQLSYGLCHTYARSTRSVSIVPPVYYADIVCSRARAHYNPNIDFSETSSVASGEEGSAVNVLMQSFERLHPSLKTSMYFQ